MPRKDPVSQFIHSIPVDKKTGFLVITLYELKERVEKLLESTIRNNMV